MNVIQIVPPKQLSLSIPKDLHRTLTLTNLTLHSVFVAILNSHPQELSLSQDSFLLQAFEERKIDITLNWIQESDNLSVGKLRIYYQEIEQQKSLQDVRAIIFAREEKIQWQQLDVKVDLDGKSLDFLNYQLASEQSLNDSPTPRQAQKKYYLMQRVSHHFQSLAPQQLIYSRLKNDILTYLQALPGVLSIDPQNNGSFLIEFQQDKQDHCQMVSFAVDHRVYVYAIKRIVSYGQARVLQPLITMNQSGPSISQPRNISPQKNSQESNEKILEKKEVYPSEQNKNIVKEKKLIAPTKTFAKQSFLGRREIEKVKTRRKNKSEEKIIEHSSDEEEEAELFKQQIKDLKQAEGKETKNQKLDIEDKKGGHAVEKIIEKQIIKETSIEFTQKILNLYIEEKEDYTQVFVVLRDCVRWFVIGDPHAKKTIKFDPIYQENINMPCPVEKYKDDLIFGNQTTLFWVNLLSDQTQWKYVQRKYIYSLAVIEELSLVTVGGKNFSKLSYFGKETSRSNIKLYSCSAGDKHEHLFTYDMPGNNVGNIMGLAYVTVPPHGVKLLLAHSLNQASASTFHFLRVKAFNKIEVYAQIDVDELGILNLLKFKYNRESGRVVCMEALGDTEMDSFKQLKLRCQYEKVEVSTEGLKFPLKRYVSMQLGGGKESRSREWMSLVDEGGSLLYLYNFESHSFKTVELSRGEIRQIFMVNDGQQLLICTDGTIFIREAV